VRTRYRLNQETLSVSLPGAEKREFTYIPVGTIITICGPETGKLVEVAWDDRTALVFSEDIHERADQVFAVVEQVREQYEVVRA
jgi:hypothetical protein